MTRVFVVFVVAVVSTLAAGLPGLERNQLTTFSHPGARISGGERAKVGQFPYQVSLYLVKDASSSTWCGGSLISEHYVLTAAHCVYEKKTATVYLGTIRRDAASLVIITEDIIIHENYVPATLSNDIALIFMRSGATLTSNIQIVPLPRMLGPYSSYLGDTVIASGWGKTTDSSPYVSDVLYFMFRKVSPNSECLAIYGPDFVKDSHICITTEDKISTCSGDSGGPLVLNDYQRTLIGVTSFGAQEGCEQGYPIAFTRVTSYLDWIKKNSGVYYN